MNNKDLEAKNKEDTEKELRNLIETKKQMEHVTKLIFFLKHTYLLKKCLFDGC